MKKELPKVYEPREVEGRVYEMWEKNGCFEGHRDPDKRPFTIVMPPPNVTGQLHMGHAMDCTLQDILIRFKRMQGYAALWVPGTDHAGIATQIKVEEELRGKEGLTRYDLGREKFLERVWDWKHKFGNRIVEQQKKLGASCDWSRARFTMDEGLSNAVRHVFVSLYNKGLIYKGSRIINWCPHCVTALSDAEVEYKEKPGHLWHIRYPIAGEEGRYVTVATTRPETMMGDTGVAVNPEDGRYRDIVGKKCILPLVNKEIPIVADAYVDMEFGTGCVKMTPAHDPNDFEVGLRHNLESIRVLDDNGKVVEGYGRYSGMDRYEARKAMVEDLKNQGLLVKVVPHSHNVGTHDRCKTTVEPMVKQQWFVRMDEMAKPAIEALKSGRLKFVPESFGKTYLHWLENIRDWCISRQLWWGHRIPAYYCQDCGETVVAKEAPHTCPKCGGSHFKQDEDTLDTWFSSALWPFSTLGWPKNSEDLDYFYPTDVLVTGYDIIFFWVARMIFSACEHTGKPPFHTVFIHGLVRDDKGRKMSKSLGNGIDPLEMADQYGADALRFNLITGNSPGNDMRFYTERCEAMRNFANKIWNASRFLLMNMEGYTPGEPVVETPADAWMFSRLAKAVKMVTEGIENYTFGDMARGVQQFFWNEVCDWYVEVTKARLKGEGRLQAQRNLIFVLDTSIRLMHPLMPFVTEEIWDNMPASVLDLDAEGNVDRAEALMIAKWPEPADYAKYVDEPAERAFELCRTVVSAARATRSRYRLSPKAELDVVVRAGAEDIEKLESLRSTIEPLANTASLVMGTDVEKPVASIAVVDSGVEVFVVLEGKVDLSAEKARLEKEIAAAQKELAGCEKTLANEGFVAKAAPAVVQKKRDRAAELKEILAALTAQVADFS